MYKSLVIIKIVAYKMLLQRKKDFFHISYSKTKTEFSEIICGLLTEMPNESSVFTEEDIEL